MAILKRLLHKSDSAAPGNQDVWCLVFDTDTKRLYVEHEWESAEAGGGAAESGVVQMDIEDYLTQGGQTAGHKELWRLLRGIFEDGSSAAKS